MLWVMCGHVFPQEPHWMPEANIRQAVREALELPAGEPLAKEKMQRFEFLGAHHIGISDITGLEFATNLRELYLSKNPMARRYQISTAMVSSISSIS